MRTRVQDYERRGIQASLELQQAARRVAWENERLRGLMASKGVARQEIEDYLEHCRRGSASPDSVPNGRYTPLVSSVGSPSKSSCHQEHPLKPNVHRDVEGMPIETDPRSGDTSPSAETESVTIQRVSHSHSTIDGADPPKAPDETSCEVAANIIASMRWHGDKEEARVELGCDGPRECTVKNTTVFSNHGYALNSHSIIMTP